MELPAAELLLYEIKLFISLKLPQFFFFLRSYIINRIPHTVMLIFFSGNGNFAEIIALNPFTAKVAISRQDTKNSL